MGCPHGRLASFRRHAECHAAGMRKYVSAQEYVAKLNLRLQHHPDYRPGMKFTLHGQRGFDWMPGGNVHPFADVSAAVRKEFAVGDSRDAKVDMT